VLYEINTWVWLSEWRQTTGSDLTLGNLPDTAWDRIADLGVGAVWLMGVWERSPAGVDLSRQDHSLHRHLREAVPDLQPQDLVGSPYCVRRYEVDPRLGGAPGLAAARKALSKRGIRLILDFVPNHVAPDHPWVTSHPDWLIGGSARDLSYSPNAFLSVAGNVLARGRDPYFPPWSDVLQLNVFHRELRAATIAELRRIAAQCDGVRCDMAMLVLNDVFSQTWGKRAGSIANEEYWGELIGALQSSHPDFHFIAEAYWGLEPQLLELGFDACYDKTLYDRMAHGNAHAIREHLSIRLGKCVRFLENHDEPRAAHVFGGQKGVAAAVAFLTLPGARLIHEGQSEGRTIRAPVHVGRRPEEKPDPILVGTYDRLFRVVRQNVFHKGHWSLCASHGWPDNQTHEELLAWTWHDESERWLTVVNYSAAPAQGRIALSWDDLKSKSWILTDALNDVTYERSGDELAGSGLYVSLNAWSAHLFRLAEAHA
jgi:hypothetical protein